MNLSRWTQELFAAEQMWVDWLEMLNFDSYLLQTQGWYAR